MSFFNPLVMKIIGAVVLVLLIVGFFTVRSCQQSAQHAAESRLQQGQMGALSNSAQDALATQGNVAANATASEDLSRTNAEEIRNAKGADARVDPAANAAGLRALCRRAAYRDSPKCRVRDPHTP